MCARDSEVSLIMQNAMNPASSTLQIPQDLFREILEHLQGDKLSLCTVSLSSIVLRHEAQMILFRNVVDLPTESAHVKFLETVAASPSRLALLVRAYRILKMNISRDLSARIHEALQAMRNLDSLCVYYAGKSQLQSPVAVLRRCAFKLERFYWTSDPSEAPELIETFLRMQDKLKHVTIWFANPISPVPIRPVASTVITCPQLVSLVANWEVINTLLPGNKISTLQVLHSFIRPSRKIDINSLAPALKCIKSFSYEFGFPYEELPPLECVLPHCTSLAVLEISSFTEENIFTVLPKLPPLHTLVLSWDFHDASWEEEAAELVRRIFDNSGVHLQQVDVQIDSMTYEQYTRSRGEEDPIPTISENEVRAMFPE